MLSPFEFGLLMIASSGGTGTIALLIRQIQIRMFLGACCVALFVWGVITLTQHQERANGVVWHYNGTVEFSQIPERGNISITFTNTLDKKLRIADVRLLVEKKVGNSSSIAFQSDVLSSYRNDDINPTDFVLGARQTVTMTLPYKFSPQLHRGNVAGEIDHLVFSASDGYDPFHKVYNDPSLVSPY